MYHFVVLSTYIAIRLYCIVLRTTYLKCDEKIWSHLEFLNEVQFLYTATLRVELNSSRMDGRWGKGGNEAAARLFFWAPTNNGKRKQNVTKRKTFKIFSSSSEVLHKPKSLHHLPQTRLLKCWSHTAKMFELLGI